MTIDTAQVQEDDVTLKSQLDTYFYDLKRFLKVAIEITKALDILHENNEIHGGLTSSTVFVNTKNNTITPLSNYAKSIPIDNVENSYVAPEVRTINLKTIDYRSDFFSLGAIFYEMLTRSLPMYSDDNSIYLDFGSNKTIPVPVIKIVEKLLSRYPEDRYQSGLGLIDDLNKCLAQLEVSGVVKYFYPGRTDKPRQLIFGDYLYGRASEEKEIIDIYNKVSEGESAFLMIFGSAGVGKTSLIIKTIKPLAAGSGIFLSGKYDQYVMRPYSALIDAFKQLTKSIIDDRQSAGYWRQQILHALQDNAQLMIDMIPELEALIGKQEPVESLDPDREKNRFIIVFQSFISVFARKEHPLVIFLDDLHWVDTPSFELLGSLFGKQKYFLLISASRRESCDQDHPLQIYAIESQKEKYLHIISLKELSQNSIAEMISEIFRQDQNMVEALSTIVFSKTLGNPFYTKQLVKGMVDRQLISFNPGTREWKWQVDELSKFEVTENVGKFIAERVHYLPSNTRLALKYASCLGSQFEVKELAIIMRNPAINVALDLWNAVDQGLLVPLCSEDYYSEALLEFEDKMEYKFLHDKIQEEAHSLISEDEKEALFYSIGKRILENLDKVSQEKKIYGVVDLINKGYHPKVEDNYRNQVISLNITASKKAKRALAYEISYKYIKQAYNIVFNSAWDASSYTVKKTVQQEISELAYHCRHFEESEKYFSTLLDIVKTRYEKAEVLSGQIQLYLNQNSYEKAIDSGVRALKILGIVIPVNVSSYHIAGELVKISLRSMRIKPCNITDQDIDMDPANVLANKIMSNLTIVAYYARQDSLFVLIILKTVLSMLRKGPGEYSSFACMSYAFLLYFVLNKKSKAIEFRDVAMRLVSMFDNLEMGGKVNWVGGLINTYYSSLNTGLKNYFRCRAYSDKSGNLLYSAYSLCSVLHSLTTTAYSLSKIENLVDDNIEMVKGTRDDHSISALYVVKQMARSLQGYTKNKTDFSDDDYSESEHLDEMLKNKHNIALHLYYIFKLRNYYLYGEYEKAMAMVKESNKIKDVSRGLIHVTEQLFYTGLVLSKLFETSNSVSKIIIRIKLKRVCKYFEALMSNCYVVSSNTRIVLT